MKPMPIRKKMAVITIVLWGLSILGFVNHYSPLYEGAFIRSAIAMTALWLAWPEIVRFPRWLFIAVPLIMIVAVFQPRILLAAVPLLLLYGFLIPKPKKRPKSSNAVQKRHGSPLGNRSSKSSPSGNRSPRFHNAGAGCPGFHNEGTGRPGFTMREPVAQVFTMREPVVQVSQ